LLEYHPLIYNKTLESGTNKPVVCRAVNHEGNKEDIVIKLLSGERMDFNAFQREYLASRLAGHLLINTPEPYVAVITDVFVESQQGEPQYLNLQVSKGKNFSTKYIQGLELVGPVDKLRKQQLNDALKIFAFDIMIQNPDRTVVFGKPNLFTTGSDLWVLDHEIAFSFLVPLIGRPATDPWIIHPIDMQMIQNHVLYSKLKGKNLDFSILDNFLDKINDDFWENVENNLPIEWKSVEFEQIKTHITAIKNNQNDFVNQIKSILL